MENKMEWNPPAAQSWQEIMDALFFAASGLKSQVLSSPALAIPELSRLKSRISEIADELHWLQQDAGSK